MTNTTRLVLPKITVQTRIETREDVILDLTPEDVAIITRPYREAVRAVWDVASWALAVLNTNDARGERNDVIQRLDYILKKTEELAQ